MTHPFRLYRDTKPKVKIMADLDEDVAILAGQRAERCKESKSAYIRRLIENDLRECGMLDSIEAAS